MPLASFEEFLNMQRLGEYQEEERRKKAWQQALQTGTQMPLETWMKSKEPDIYTRAMQDYLTSPVQLGLEDINSFRQRYRQSISPAREVLADFLLGMSAKLTGQPFKSTYQRRMEEWLYQQQQREQEEKYRLSELYRRASLAGMQERTEAQIVSREQMQEKKIQSEADKLRAQQNFQYMRDALSYYRDLTKIDIKHKNDLEKEDVKALDRLAASGDFALIEGRTLALGEFLSKYPDKAKLPLSELMKDDEFNKIAAKYADGLRYKTISVRAGAGTANRLNFVQWYDGYGGMHGGYMSPTQGFIPVEGVHVVDPAKALSGKAPEEKYLKNDDGSPVLYPATPDTTFSRSDPKELFELNNAADTLKLTARQAMAIYEQWNKTGRKDDFFERFNRTDAAANLRLALVGKGYRETELRTIHQTMGAFLASYLRAISGRQVSDRERQFIASLMPNLKESLTDPEGFMTSMSLLTLVSDATRIRMQMGVDPSELPLDEIMHEIRNRLVKDPMRLRVYLDNPNTLLYLAAARQGKAVLEDAKGRILGVVDEDQARRRQFRRGASAGGSSVSFGVSVKEPGRAVE